MEDHKPEEELYDLRNDPHETRNLALLPQYQNILKDMRFRMDSWQKNNNDIGLKDLNDRVPEDMGDVKNYVMNKYPDEWKNSLKVRYATLTKSIHQKQRRTKRRNETIIFMYNVLSVPFQYNNRTRERYDNSTAYRR